MKKGLLTAISVAALIGVVSLALVAAAPGQGASAKLRTPWGDPDLQGVWSGETPTPLERPLTGERVVQSEEEAAALEEELAKRWEETRGGGGDPNNLTGSYNAFWQNRGTPVIGRASLITDPPDGRRPPLTPLGESIRAAAPPRGFSGKAEGPEDRNEGERCLHWERTITGVVNQQYRIVQAPGYVAINSERLHENRVIRLGDRTHLPDSLRQWKGDSIGRFEGDTLVVETRNFSPVKRDRLGASKDMRLTERFTRVDENTVNYEATVDDPTIWTRPWTYSLPLRLQPADTIALYEYACHEGNYGMVGILAGARADERRASGGSR